MAEVTITVRDIDGDAIQMAVSAKPDIPLTNGEADVDSPVFTPAMAAAIMAAHHVSGRSASDSAYGSRDEDTIYVTMPRELADALRRCAYAGTTEDVSRINRALAILETVLNADD